MRRRLNNKRLGRDFKQFRERTLQNFSLTDCARVLKILPSTLSRFENGRGVNGNTLAYLCTYTDLDVRLYVQDEPSTVDGKQKTLPFIPPRRLP